MSFPSSSRFSTMVLADPVVYFALERNASCFIPANDFKKHFSLWGFSSEQERDATRSKIFKPIVPTPPYSSTTFFFGTRFPLGRYVRMTRTMFAKASKFACRNTYGGKYSLGTGLTVDTPVKNSSTPLCGP